MLVTTALFAQIEENLIAHYPFNGNADDVSANEFSGEIIGATFTENRFGEENKALLFNGTSDYLLINDNEVLRLSGSYTISFWIKVDEFTNDLAYSILSKRSSIGQDGYALQIIGSNHPILTQGAINFLVSGSAVPYLHSDEGIEAGTWSHVVLTFDNSNNLATGYIDAVEVCSSTIPNTNSATTEPLKVGKDNQSSVNSFLFNGTLDDLKFFNRALTAGEVADLVEIETKVEAAIILSDITVMPNPARDNINVELINRDEIIYNITIVDMDGKKVFSRKKCEGNQTIDIRTLASGTYIIALQDEQGRYIATKKFIKLIPRC